MSNASSTGSVNENEAEASGSGSADGGLRNGSRRSLVTKRSGHQRWGASAPPWLIPGVYPASPRGFVYVSGRRGCKNRTRRQENRLEADVAAAKFPDRERKAAGGLMSATECPGGAGGSRPWEGQGCKRQGQDEVEDGNERFRGAGKRGRE